MEIFTLLETLEDILEKSKKVPFTNKAVVDKDEIVEIIQEIRLKLPDELKQAKWIKEERQRILLEAQKEADGVVKEAESRIAGEDRRTSCSLPWAEYGRIHLCPASRCTSLRFWFKRTIPVCAFLWKMLR